MPHLRARLFALWSALLVALTSPAAACGGAASICERASPGAAALIAGGRPPVIVADPKDDAGVARAVRDLAVDFERVAGNAATVVAAPQPHERTAIIVGTIGRSALIDRLIAEGKVDANGVRGEWEAYLHQLVDNPAPGVARALVIAGSDKRGTIFGIYDLSQRIGVSPWHWWADVPVARKGRLFVGPGRRVEKPAVKYRGIFINDEEPALGNWARQTFGGINARFYERVFELILRQRGNYLWPAMWGKSLWEDDPASARLADEMGVVLGTSHHEPMMRAHVDWERNGQGPWDYTKNAERLRQFWREGLERTRGNEQLVTIGMRGDGDEPMTQGTATALLERIVADQRRIIADVTGRPASETPQVWALYKEVQDYFDAGMTVPDDVTLLFADDNWGNIRRLPRPGEQRPGGYGVYYHFDYVGGPRNYKWLNTNQIERVWEQMHLAYRHGARQLWIVNVGDIKPMEFPTSFFLDYAWNPEEWPLERLGNYPRVWAERQFGAAQAVEIGELLTRYAHYASRRKPELLSPDTYSLDNFGEWGRVIGEWDALERRAAAVRDRLPAQYRDAYFQFVLHPIMANANLHRLYHTVARNRRAAEEGRAAEANALADEAERLFARDAAIRRIYEQEIAGGKWAHMMSQTHIGYTGWQQPERDVMPEVRRLPVPSDAAAKRAAKPAAPKEAGVVAVEAPHFGSAIGDAEVSWRTIPNLGRTLGGVTMFPVTASPRTPGGKSPHLAYPVELSSAGEAEIELLLSPTLDFRGQGGLRYAISIDDAPPQIVNLHAGITEADWAPAVSDNVWTSVTRHKVAAPGRHVIKVWMVDPGLVFQRLHIWTGPKRASYLGPPENARRRAHGVRRRSPGGESWAPHPTGGGSARSRDGGVALRS